MEAAASGAKDKINASAGVVVVPGVAGQRLSLKSLFISCSAAAAVTILDEAGVVVWPTGYFPANGGLVRDNISRSRFRASQQGMGFVVKSSGADLLSCAIEAFVD